MKLPSHDVTGSEDALLSRRSLVRLSVAGTVLTTLIASAHFGNELLQPTLRERAAIRAMKPLDEILQLDFTTLGVDKKTQEDALATLFETAQQVLGYFTFRGTSLPHWLANSTHAEQIQQITKGIQSIEQTPSASSILFYEYLLNPRRNTIASTTLAGIVANAAGVDTRPVIHYFTNGEMGFFLKGKFGGYRTPFSGSSFKKGDRIQGLSDPSESVYEIDAKKGGYVLIEAINLCSHLHRDRKFDQAEQLARSQLAIHPQDYSLREIVANCLLNKDRPNTAFRFFMQGESTYLNRAFFWERAAQYAKSAGKPHQHYLGQAVLLYNEQGREMDALRVNAMK